jgi:hypothetical protein
VKDLLGVIEMPPDIRVRHGVTIENEDQQNKRRP